MEKKVYQIKSNDGRVQYVKCEPADNGKIVMMAKDNGLFRSVEDVRSAVVTEVEDTSNIEQDQILPIYHKIPVLCLDDEDGNQDTICIVRSERFGTDDLRNDLHEILVVRLDLEDDEDSEVIADFEKMVDIVSGGADSWWLDYELYYEFLDLI